MADKDSLQSEQHVVSGADCLTDARQWAAKLEASEAGGGPLEPAWDRLERRYGIPARHFWAFRYRPPKQIAADLYERLRLACLDQCERVVRSAQHDMAVLQAKGRRDVGCDVASLEAEARELLRKVQELRGEAT